MKKIAIFFIITILIVCAIFAMYISYKANYNMSKKTNLAFEKYLNEEVYGTDLATVINRAVDRNEKNYHGSRSCRNRIVLHFHGRTGR